jgi:hypothetical protein
VAQHLHQTQMEVLHQVLYLHHTTSGFSIVSLIQVTGSPTADQSIGHGLGVAPSMIIVKDRDTAVNWSVNNQPLCASLGDYTRYLTLDSTSAVSGPGNTQYQNAAFTSTVFNVGTNATTNNNTSTYIAYCFAEKQGYSKFGSYTGNGNADGTFVYTGFKPAFIMVKVTTTANSYDHWIIYDNKRIGYNVAGNRKIYADASDAEPGDTDLIDILSNGFKFRNTHSNANGSGQTYIYMAFAEEPLVGDNPATAR